MCKRAVSALLAYCCCFVAAAFQKPYGLPLEGTEAEDFLKNADVVAMRPIGVGITRSQQVTLTDGERTVRAVWKTIDEVRPGLSEDEAHRGRYQMGFRDSYKYEIAACELDKLLGLGVVPPTVEREIRGRTGSLQLWAEGSFTELERRERALSPKDPLGFSRQIQKVRLLDQLIYNTDWQNIRNVLFDPDFRVYAIDHSRSFRLYHSLLAEEELIRFSRLVLERLRKLDRPMVEARLGRWLREIEIDALLARRDLIVALADRLIAERGEAAVLDPDSEDP